MIIELQESFVLLFQWILYPGLAVGVGVTIAVTIAAILIREVG